MDYDAFKNSKIIVFYDSYSKKDIDRIRFTTRQTYFVNISDFFRAEYLKEVLSKIAEGNLFYFHLSSFDLAFYREIECDTGYRFTTRQFQALLQSTIELIPGNRYVLNNASAAKKWSFKPYQLVKLHNCCKVTIPDYQISAYTPPATGESMILKNISESRFIESGIVSTQLLFKRDAFPIDNECPSIIQEYVTEGNESKVYYIRSECYQFRIEKVANKEKEDGIQITNCLSSPEKNIEALCDNISKEIGLSCFSLDVIHSRGRIYLLEVNTLPSWGWMPRSYSDVLSSALKRGLEFYVNNY